MSPVSPVLPDDAPQQLHQGPRAGVAQAWTVPGAVLDPPQDDGGVAFEGVPPSLAASASSGFRAAARRPPAAVVAWMLVDDATR